MTAIAVFERGPAVQRAVGLRGRDREALGARARSRSATAIGDAAATDARTQFAPPTLESVVVAGDPTTTGRGSASRSTQLAEQDPLINVRQDDERQRALGLALRRGAEGGDPGDAGERLRRSTSTFRETTPIYVERPVGTGEAVELLHAESNPFLATIGLRVEPAPAGSGHRVPARRRPPHGAALHLQDARRASRERMGEYVRDALREGLYGWQVTDCVVTMTRVHLQRPRRPAVDGAARSARSPTSGSSRRSSLMQALEQAGTVVCEPIVRARLEVPTARSAGAMLAALGARSAPPCRGAGPHGELSTLETVLPAGARPGASAAAAGADGRRGRARVRLRRLRARQRRAAGAPAADGESRSTPRSTCWRSRGASRRRAERHRLWTQPMRSSCGTPTTIAVLETRFPWTSLMSRTTTR